MTTSRLPLAFPSTIRTCDADLALQTWEIDARKGYGPGANAHDPIPADAPRQQALPMEYRTLTSDELRTRIRAAKYHVGDRVIVVGHFYQRDDIVEHADFIGDSFQLARVATERPDAEAIVFCGVHFMAETADILSTDRQAVMLPNLAAGCSMADMATIAQVEDAWNQLEAVLGTDPSANGLAPLLPITYMNSSAQIKAFCGRKGGIVCTSSNARQVLTWAFERAERVIFLPDQHLGRNTAKAMGISLDQMPLWDPAQPLGGNQQDRLLSSKVILWKGYCSVHQRFTVQQIEQARQSCPEVRIIVHPECSMEVVDAADGSGSTDFITKDIAAAAPGAVIGVGTEINLVRRLAAQNPDKTIFCLDDLVCPCSTMYRIHPGYLCWVLESMVRGEIVNQISVPADIQKHSKVALERMLAVKK